MAVIGVEDRFYSRNVVFVLPLVAGLAAPALLRARAVPLVGLVVLSAMTAVWVASNWRYEQLDWRSAVARMVAVDPAAAVVSTDPGNAVVVSTYLGRGPVASARATAVWVAVPPVRGPHERALSPVPLPTGILLSGFRPVRELEVHGFRLVLERARTPEQLAAQRLPGAVLFPP
jgi:hypothetical protein